MLQFGYGNKYQRKPEHQKLWSASCNKGQACRSKYVPDVAVPFACIAPEQKIQAPHSKHKGERDGHIIERGSCTGIDNPRSDYETYVAEEECCEGHVSVPHPA